MLTMVWVLCVCCVPAPSPLSPSQGIGDRSGAFSGVCIFACVPCVRILFTLCVFDFNVYGKALNGKGLRLLTLPQEAD